MLFNHALNNRFTFSTALKVNPIEGNLVYEYNPFFNYRLDRTMAYIRIDCGNQKSQQKS